MENINGWLNLHKPAGITSAKAVAIVKKALNVKKVGHAGTLDPLASGVLPLAIGEATKTVQFCAEAEKEYEFTIKWGEATTTGDVEGDVKEVSNVRPTRAQVLGMLPKFIGRITQVPPIYSAIKVDGRRAYDLARKGENIELKPREIEIYNLCIADGCAGAESEEDSSCVTFVTTCGKGTYIRSLAEDIARSLGTVGHVTRLIRTKVGNFLINDAILLENIGKRVYNDTPSEGILPVDIVLDDIQVLEVTPEEAAMIRHGKKLVINNTGFASAILNNQAEGGVFAAKCNRLLVAVCECGDGLLRPIRVFNL